MSQALDIAETIRTRLATPPASGELATLLDLSQIADQIIVDRQKSILSDVAKAVSKAKGTAIVILWQGYQPASSSTSRPRMEQSYNIAVHSKPVLTSNDWAADDVMQSILVRLWRWVPDGGHFYGEAKIGSGGLVPDKSFLIYDVEVAFTATLPITQTVSSPDAVTDGGLTLTDADGSGVTDG